MYLTHFIYLWRPEYRKKSQKQVEESMLPETSGEHINTSSVDIFRLPMKTLPDAVDEAVDNMSLLDKKRLRREMGIPSLSVSRPNSTQEEPALKL